MNYAISFNGGKESIVILHKYLPTTNIVFRIDEKNDFDEVNQYVKYICDLWNINLLVFSTVGECINTLINKYNVTTVVLGCRRTDPGCSNLNTIQVTDKGWPQILRFNPLINWTYKQVWQYIEEHNLPVCILYEKGYTSLGNKFNTFPNSKLFLDQSLEYKHAKYLENGEDERNNRINTNLPHKLIGNVIRGKGVGKQIGFPTANLDTPNTEIDAGVYYGFARFVKQESTDSTATIVTLNNNCFKMVMISGVNPQYKDTTIEAHILSEFAEDFYGKTLELEVIGFIRKMEKFEILDLLIDAINRDITIANSGFKSYATKN